MKRLASALAVLASLLLLPGGAAASDTPAVPVSALFYPDEIHLTVEERITPAPIPGKGPGLRIILPVEAARNTFSVSVNEVPANSFYWLDEQPEAAPAFRENGEADPGEQAVAPEKQKYLDAITALEEEQDAKNAASRARKTRIALWEGLDVSDDKFKTDDILKLDTVFAERLGDLYAAESKHQREMDGLREKLDEARAALARYEASRVRHHVAVIPFSGDRAANVRYSYIMPGSSGTAYRLTAYPTRDTLSIEQDVTLFQNSGKTWDNVEVYVSTARRDTTLRPRPLAPWRIHLRETEPPAPPRPAERKMAMEVQMSQMPRMDNSMEMGTPAALAPPAAPVREEKGTFRLWSLGRKTISAGVGITLPLSKDEYAANYYYTLQPSVNPRGFLTASLSLDTALELPRGNARLFVDDVAIGEQPMAINGTRATLFFGTDPLVTATMRDLKHTKSEKGLISKEQTVLWDWEITVRNARGRAVDVSIQDPLPDEQDTAIKLVVESDPKPEKAATATQLGATKIYEWKLTMQPNEVKTITHKVSITAPADKYLQTGRMN